MKKTFRYFFIFLFVIACLLPTYCAQAKSSSWKVYTKNTTKCLTANEKNLFKQATEKTKSITYKPIAMLGSSIAAGPKYSYLCLGTKNKKNNMYIVTIYNQAGGTLQLLSSKKINLTKPKTKKITTLPSGPDNNYVMANTNTYQNVGGFQINTSLKKGKVPKKVAKAYNTIYGTSSSKYAYPICLLSTRQTKKGTDYKLLARNTIFSKSNVSQEPTTTQTEDDTNVNVVLPTDIKTPIIEILTIHVDSKGNPSETKRQTLNISAYR